ncbi:hypothetical protein D3G74_25940 [Escherichia coli]|nr:hypothetical protein [Escherichia coli]EFB2411185.1 hypothetical protein [Escherichia coli]EFB2416373.1 hypothetical protein [Escherichia coli]EFB2426127.1 hypothetical protein [Escherichia coli]EFB2459705.1 hypothetical protein [Escherichia coli]
MNEVQQIMLISSITASRRYMVGCLMEVLLILVDIKRCLDMALIRGRLIIQSLTVAARQLVREGFLQER